MLRQLRCRVTCANVTVPTAQRVLLATAVIVGMLALSVVGWLLSIQLQRVISGPVLHLVRTAKTVSDRMDYSVRAVKRTEDEVGLLIDSFNEMLTQIEKRMERGVRWPASLSGQSVACNNGAGGACFILHQ